MMGEGPRRQGEVDRYTPLDSAWVVISRNDKERFAVELGSISRQPDGSYRIRTRTDITELQPDPPGPYHAIIIGLEINCPRRRVRRWSRRRIRFRC